MASAAGAAATADPLVQMTNFQKLATLVGETNNPAVSDLQRCQALQSIADNMETITSSPLYPSFLEHTIPIFLRVMNEGEPQFLVEQHGQQIRKMILEIFHRLPCNVPLQRYSQNILSLMFKLLDVDNEENVLICLRIIIELHKQFRPPFTLEVSVVINAIV